MGMKNPEKPGREAIVINLTGSPPRLRLQQKLMNEFIKT
jgi:hypothetical protein